MRDEYIEGVEDLIHYCIFNNIKKTELQCFLSKKNNYLFLVLISTLKLMSVCVCVCFLKDCASMTDLIKFKSGSGFQVDKLLKLYQLFK